MFLPSTKALSLLLLLAFATTAQSVDFRSWDQRIDESSRRFIVLEAFASEAVLDKETQLVWMRTPVFASSVNWHSAVHLCLTSRRGEARGWRLPSYTELASLADRTGRLLTGHPFESIPTDYFWSSTKASNSDVVYARALLDDRSSGKEKTDRANVLCVRGPGANDGF